MRLQLSLSWWLPSSGLFPGYSAYDSTGYNASLILAMVTRIRAVDEPTVGGRWMINEGELKLRFYFILKHGTWFYASCNILVTRITQLLESHRVWWHLVG